MCTVVQASQACLQLVIATFFKQRNDGPYQVNQVSLKLSAATEPYNDNINFNFKSNTTIED